MNPLLAEGKVTSSNIGDLRFGKMGEVTFLTGGNKSYEEITAETPVDFLRSRLQNYRNYVRLSTTRMTHKDKIEAPGLDGTFEIEIEVSARLAIPFEFVRTYGHGASLLAPFYNRSLADIRTQALGRRQNEIHVLNNGLSSDLAKIRLQHPVYDGVEVQEFVAIAKPDPDFAQEELAFQIGKVYHEHGSDGLALLTIRYPQHKELIRNYIVARKEFGTEDGAYEDEKFQRILKQAEELVKIGAIERDEVASLIQLQEMRNRAKVTSGIGNQKSNLPEIRHHPSTKQEQTQSNEDDES